MTTDPLATLLESIPYGGGMTTTVLAARLAAAGVTLTQPNTAHQPCLDCKSGGSAHWHDGTEHRSQPQPDAGLREALEKFVTGEGAMATDPDGDCYFCEAEGVDFELPFHPGADPDHAGEHEDWRLVPIARAALRSTPAAPQPRPDTRPTRDTACTCAAEYLVCPVHPRAPWGPNASPAPEPAPLDVERLAREWSEAADRAATEDASESVWKHREFVAVQRLRRAIGEPNTAGRYDDEPRWYAARGDKP